MYSAPRPFFVRLGRTLAAAAVLLAAAGGVARAQDARRACDSTAFGVAVGEGVDTVYLTLAPGARGQALGRMFAAGVLDAVADELRLPGGVTGAVMGMAGRADGAGGALVTGPVFASTFFLDLRRDGRLASARVSQRSLVDGVDEAVYRAVRAADSARTFVGRERGPETLPLVLRLSFQPDSGEARRAVAVLRQPRYAGAENVRLLSALPLPGTAAARDGVSNHPEGGVRAAFEVVVDARGRPVPGTERLAEFNNPAYAVQLYHWLRHDARFAPARVNGCPVRQLLWWGVRATTTMH